jgi:hypothetical protein
VTPVIERLMWRLDAYDRICRACAQGNVAPMRFLTFRPDKMRLRIGESLMRSQVPVIFAPDLAERLIAYLPSPSVAPSTGSLELDRDSLRRLLSLAQIDGDLDPLEVHAWMRMNVTHVGDTVGTGAASGPDSFMQMFASLTDKFLDEAKASAGGEDTAALFQLIALSSLRNTLLHHLGASERFLGLAALLAHLCDRALTETVKGAAGEGLTARLGLLMAASCSPISLMGAPIAVAARPANAYRTVPTAFQRARDMLRASMDQPRGFDVASARARIAAEMLSNPERKRDLVRATLAEGVRDLALLSVITQGSELRDIASQSSALSDALFQPLGPEKLRARIDRHPRGREEPLGKLAQLVDSVGAVLAGDTEPLARMGSVEERADLAAAGAIVLAFDELALEQGGHALAMVRPVLDDEAPRARAEGRAYWFGIDDEPLFLLPKRREEAFLFADMKDFTKRTVALREEAMGDFLKQHFYEPILRTCAHFARNPNARVSVANLLGDAVACRGDIRSMVALALYVRKLLEDAARDLADAQASLKSSDEGVLKEIELEIARTERDLMIADGAEKGAMERHLVELKAGRDEKMAKIVGAGLEAGVFVTWGREANVIEVGGPEVGEWKVIIAEQLNAAARGTSRSASLVKVRNARKADDERRTGTARTLIDPFQVHCQPDPNDVSPGTDFHNAGSALSGDALAAYQAVCPELTFRRLTITPSTLPATLRNKYWLSRPTEELVLCSDAAGKPALLFRWSGRTIFRGLEANGPLDIWEVLLVDPSERGAHGFGRDFVTALAAAESARG